MNKGLKTTINKLLPAVSVSFIATALGLLSLYKSKVPMIKDFGLMLTIGIAVAFLLALLILLPVLSLRTKLGLDKLALKKKKLSKYTSVMKSITKFTLKFKYVVLGIATLLAVLGFIVDGKVPVETDMETFMPQDSVALSDIKDLRTLIGSTDRIVIMYESDVVDDYKTVSSVREITNMLEEDYASHIITVGSISTMLDMVSNKTWNEENFKTALDSLPEAQLRLLESKENNLGIINISFSSMSSDEFSTFITDLNTSLDSLNTGLKLTITGQSVVDSSMLTSMTSDRLFISIISIVLVFIVLLIIFRNIFKAVAAVLPIILIVGWSGLLMYLLGFSYTPLTSTIGALIIGIGTEYTILILMRYFEYYKKTLNHKESIIRSTSIMSKPIIVSALTTIGGFSALVFSDFQILSNFGIMTLINITLALISSLIVLPAFLGILTKNKKSLLG